MLLNGKKAVYGQSNASDRLSDLPDYILHHVISFLGTKESCRTTLLSKRWSHVWSTGLILDFNPRFFDDKSVLRRYNDPYNKETIDGLMNFVETTMRRYSEQNLSIRKLKLEYPTTDQGMTGRIDRWLGIAVQNQLEALLLSITHEGSPSYRLPSILFTAKSLISMECCKVIVPYCQALKLTSLQSLKLSQVDIDEHMLQHIILSCPLKELELRKCSGIKNIAITHWSRLESLEVMQAIPIGGTIMLDTSTLRHFSYQGYHENDSLPFILKPASKKNLRALSLVFAIMDNIVEKLMSELPSIKTMTFCNCKMPKNTRIASPTLEELSINECYDLVSVTIDAPKLDFFCYIGGVELSSVISTHGKCNAHLHLTLDDLDTRAFCGIKNLLSKSKCCKELSITPCDEPVIELDRDQLSKISDGSPYDIPELKLFLPSVILPESSLLDLIDGLFWCCRPDMLYLSMTLACDNNSTTVMSLVHLLEKKVECWKHPLKRIECKGGDCSTLFRSWDLDIPLRLYCKTV